MTADYKEILSYATRLKETYPSISKEGVKEALSAKFIGGKDVLQLATAGVFAVRWLITKPWLQLCLTLSEK